MRIEPPSPYEIKNKYLDMEYKDMEDYVSLQREKWKTYGCTIMCDGWTGPIKLSIINFMVYYKRSTIFLNSVDASDNIKDNKYIYDCLKDVIKEIGEANVVQIITDNGSSFVKAGKLLMKKYNLYWTPCAAHCIDLMFEDIGKRESVFDLITNARKITNFIYNHGWLVAIMRKVCGGDIVHLGCDAPKPGGPLTTRQPAEHKWMSGYPTPLQKIGQSLLCTGSYTQLQNLHILSQTIQYMQYISNHMSNTTTWAHKQYSICIPIMIQLYIP